MVRWNNPRVGSLSVVNRNSSFHSSPACRTNKILAGEERFELSSDSFGDYYFTVKLFSYIMYSKTQTRIQNDLVGSWSFFVLIIYIQLQMIHGHNPFAANDSQQDFGTSGRGRTYDRHCIRVELFQLSYGCI